jgi:hypothetical protein
VGDRYNAGQVASILSDHEPEDRARTDEGHITFELPEHAASEIQHLAEDEDMLGPCLGAEEQRRKIVSGPFPERDGTG